MTLSTLKRIATATADAELTVYKEEEETMKNAINAINEIKRTLSPKGYNHACEDFAVFTYAPGDLFAICVEARTCTSCWQVGHDEEHVYAEVGERIKVSSLLSDPDLDPFYSEEDVEYFLSIDPDWNESLPAPTVATTVAELTVPEEVNEMNNHKHPAIGKLERDLAFESMLMEANKYPAVGRLEQEKVINSAKDGLDFNTNDTAVHEEEADYMCTLKYDHGVEIFMFHNPNAGCNSGEYHTLYINGVVLDACRCGNGCHHTAAINRLEDEDYVLFLLGEIEFDPREESTVEREYLDAKERLERRGINPDEVKYFTHSTEPTGMGPIYRFVVRSFMSPARLRRENKKLLSALVEQKRDLSDFRDADIVETFETYNFDTAIDIMDTLTDLGYMRVYDLFREDDFEEEGGR